MPLSQSENVKVGCCGNTAQTSALEARPTRHRNAAGPGHSTELPKLPNIPNFPLFGFSQPRLSPSPCCGSFPIWTTFVFCLLSQLQCVLLPKPFFSLFIPRSYHTTVSSEELHPADSKPCTQTNLFRPANTVSSQSLLVESMLPCKLFLVGVPQPTALL